MGGHRHTELPTSMPRLAPSPFCPCQGVTRGLRRFQGAPARGDQGIVQLFSLFLKTLLFSIHFPQSLNIITPLFSFPPRAAQFPALSWERRVLPLPHSSGPGALCWQPVQTAKLVSSATPGEREMCLWKGFLFSGSEWLWQSWFPCSPDLKSPLP